MNQNRSLLKIKVRNSLAINGTNIMKRPISSRYSRLKKSSSLTLKSSDSGIYRVEITIDGFRYTSLSRTVLENPPGKVVVTFDSNGGTPAAPHQVFVNENDTVSKPAVNPTKTDYVFAGWYEKKDGNLKENSWVFETTPVTKNITLYAKWTVTVKFKGEHVTIPDITFPQTVTADTDLSYTLIKAEGYRLPDEIEVEMGDKELTAGTEYTYNNETGQLTLNNVSGNVVITADGVEVSKVTINIKLDSDLYPDYPGKVFFYVGADNKYKFDPDDGTCTKTIDSGTYTVKVGEDEGSAEIYLDEWDSSRITLDILFWTVTFDYNYYGSTDDTKAVLDGSTLSPPDNLTRSNYKFEGWYKEAECTNEWDLNTPPVIEEDITLYAKWRYIPPEQIHSLCLHSNDSDNLTKRYSGTYATKITLPSVESINWNNNNNCVFIEWNSKADGSGESFKAGDKFSLGSEIWNLYAVWSDSSVHNVTFNSNGGSNVSSQKVTDGYRASESETPIKEGHTFKYWSLNGEKYDFNKSVREDITLKAEYEVNQYKVSFYYKGELLTTKTADFNTSLEDRMPSLPSGTNEWNSSENGKGDKFTSDSLITKDSSVYAVSSSHSFNSVLIIGGITAIALLALLAAWLYYTRSKNQ